MISILALAIVSCAIFLMLFESLGKEENNINVKTTKILKYATIIDDENHQSKEHLTEFEIQVRKTDKDFSLSNFIQKCKLAFEIIMTGFAENNIGEISELMTNEIKDLFNQNIQERNNKILHLTLVSVSDPEILSTNIKNNIAYIEIKIHSLQMLQCSGEKDVTDTWTFKKELRLKNQSTWILCSTSSNNQS